MTKHIYSWGYLNLLKFDFILFKLTSSYIVTTSYIGDKYRTSLTRNKVSNSITNKTRMDKKRRQTPVRHIHPKFMIEFTKTVNILQNQKRKQKLYLPPSKLIKSFTVAQIGYSCNRDHNYCFVSRVISLRIMLSIQLWVVQFSMSMYITRQSQ